MNEIAVVDKGAERHRLKALVLDSVSSPIAKRVYNLGMEEFLGWYWQEARWLHEGNRGRLVGGPGSPRAGCGFNQRKDHVGQEAGHRGRDNRLAVAAAEDFQIGSAFHLRKAHNH